jgi:hypothetical protein
MSRILDGTTETFGTELEGRLWITNMESGKTRKENFKGQKQ